MKSKVLTLCLLGDTPANSVILPRGGLEFFARLSALSSPGCSKTAGLAGPGTPGDSKNLAAH